MSSYVEGYQITVWLAVGGLAVIASFGVGLAFGRRWGIAVTPHVLRKTVEDLKVSVARWCEKWRAERELRELSELREANLRGARKAWDEAKRRRTA